LNQKTTNKYATPAKQHHLIISLLEVFWMIFDLRVKSIGGIDNTIARHAKPSIKKTINPGGVISKYQRFSAKGKVNPIIIGGISVR
jgi:hypothetical protein